MHRDVWILLSPLLAIVALGLGLLVAGCYSMTIGDFRLGVHLFMVGMVCVGMCGSVAAMIYVTEKS